VTRKTDGTQGFYRAYAPESFATLEEAIEWTLLLAEEYGLVELEVRKRECREYSEGGWFVALVGARPPHWPETVPAGLAPLP